MLDCLWRNGRSKTRLGGMAADAEECCLEESAQVTDYILESCLHSAVQDLKAVLAQSRRVNFNDTVSFSS